MGPKGKRKYKVKLQSGVVSVESISAVTHHIKTPSPNTEADTGGGFSIIPNPRGSQVAALSPFAPVTLPLAGS